MSPADLAAVNFSSKPGVLKSAKSPFAREIFFAFGICLLSLLFFYRTHLFAGALHFSGNKYDSVIQAARLEHWYGVFLGKYYWRSPIFFYPEDGVLGYNDAYFLYGIFYSIYRSVGLDQLAAMDLTNALIRAVGFISTWVLLRRYFSTAVWTAAIGSVLLTISNGIYLGTMHTQLATVGLMPLAFLLGARLHELLAADRRFTAGVTAVGIAVFVVAWMMTAFYTAFMTGVFVVVSCLIFAACDRRKFYEVWVQFTKSGRFRALIPALIVFPVLLTPFALTYFPSAEAVGTRSLADVLYYSPKLYDFIDLGPDNVLWGWLSDWVRSVTRSSLSESEFWRGFTYAELALVIFVALNIRSNFLAVRRSGLTVLAISVIAGIFLQVQVGGFTLWGLVFKYIPGGGAIRVAVRYQLILLAASAIIAAVFIDRLARGTRKAKIFSVILAMVIVAEQVNLYPIARFTSDDVVVENNIPTAPARCEFFFAINPRIGKEDGPIEKKYYVHAPDAMLISTTIGLPTLNGMDSFTPNGNNLFSPLDDDYELRAYGYAWRHALLSGLCSFDLTNMTWGILNGPPEGVHTNLFGSGLTVNDEIPFARGQPGGAMLSEGWSDPENWGVWAIGLKSRMMIKLNRDDFTSTGVSLVFGSWAYLPNSDEFKILNVYMTDARGVDQLIATWKLSSEKKDHELCLPLGAIRKDGIVDVTFRGKNTYLPSELQGSSDVRALDFALSAMTVRAGSCR